MTQTFSDLRLARINQLVVPQATNCSPAVQFQSSTTWQLIPESNTDISPSRDHCYYCSPPDWEALPTLCQKNPANIPQINWCRAPGVRTDIDAEGNSHPESQWQKENVARVSMTGEHSLRTEMEESIGRRDIKGERKGKLEWADGQTMRSRTEFAPSERTELMLTAWSPLRARKRSLAMLPLCLHVKKTTGFLPKNSSDMCEDSPPEFTGKLLLFLWKWWILLPQA